MTGSSLDRAVAVHVSDHALMHLLLAGMESYKVRTWNKTVTTERGPVETGGVLLGYTTHRESMDHVVVEHVSTDTYADRKYQYVTLNSDVTEIKRQVLEDRWPHLSLIGDFHTHPYKDGYMETVGAGGWNASKGDYESYIDRDEESPWRGCCAALILTITELKRYHENTHRDSGVPQHHIVHWQQHDYRFWLSAYAIDKVDDELVVSPNPNAGERRRPHVYIDVPTINGTNAWFGWKESRRLFDMGRTAP